MSWQSPSGLRGAEFPKPQLSVNKKAHRFPDCSLLWGRGGREGGRGEHTGAPRPVVR